MGTLASPGLAACAGTRGENLFLLLALSLLAFLPPLLLSREGRVLPGAVRVLPPGFAARVALWEFHAFGLWPPRGGGEGLGFPGALTSSGDDLEPPAPLVSALRSPPSRLGRGSPLEPPPPFPPPPRPPSPPLSPPPPPPRGAGPSPFHPPPRALCPPVLTLPVLLEGEGLLPPSLLLEARFGRPPTPSLTPSPSPSPGKRGAIPPPSWTSRRARGGPPYPPPRGGERGERGPGLEGGGLSPEEGDEGRGGGQEGR